MPKYGKTKSGSKGKTIMNSPSTVFTRGFPGGKRGKK